jgi:hydrogenase large subunit
MTTTETVPGLPPAPDWKRKPGDPTRRHRGAPIMTSLFPVAQQKKSDKKGKEHMSEQIFMPLIMRGERKKIVIDPITRIEGHLRIEAQIANGRVTDAWSAGTMFRGLELVLQGRDPREAWLFAQRICGVCTTVHAICSVRAVENALGITIPDNARLVRNLIEAAQFVQDHVIHFYHLHAPDWVDVVNALSADPAATSVLARSISDWPNSSPDTFRSVQQRLQTFVDGGQLGLFGNAYWGHPAYKLPPEGNLLAVAHYLEALDWQREVIKMQAILGGKNPHPQTYLVGGMAIPVDPNSEQAINPARISQLTHLVTQGLDFVQQVYMPDLLLLASFYKEWAHLGAGPGNYLSYGDFPTRTGGDPSALWLPRGIVLGNDIDAPPQPLDQTRIKEYIAHSWYTYDQGSDAGLHPAQGETQPRFTGPTPPYDALDTDARYSWLKAPRYNDLPMEVGPLARMIVAYAAGHARVRERIDQSLAELGLGKEALFSTLGRVLARGVETQLIVEQMAGWVRELEDNMNSGRIEIHNGALWDPATWPAEATGWGSTEAPRGGLGHWVQIKDGRIANYQAVVPTTWNGSPRDARDQRGPWETALIGTPIADPEQPVEILRTVHSFDPCMACAVHVVDSQGNECVRVYVE